MKSPLFFLQKTLLIVCYIKSRASIIVDHHMDTFIRNITAGQPLLDQNSAKNAADPTIASARSKHQQPRTIGKIIVRVNGHS